MRKMNGLKWIFLGLVASAFFCFVMGGVTLRQEIARLRHKPQAPPEIWKPSPFAVAPPKVYPSAKPPALSTPPPPVISPETAKQIWQPPPAELLGKWQGGGATDTGFFYFTIEITTNPRNPAQILAYAQTLNMALPIPALGRRQPNVRELIAQRMPRQLSLVGTPSDDGAVAFHVSQAIGPQGDCPITDIRISSWGTEGVAAEWKGAACPGGSLVLKRSS
jgi:hypothetical protein